MGSPHSSRNPEHQSGRYPPSDGRGNDSQHPSCCNSASGLTPATHPLGNRRVELGAARHAWAGSGYPVRSRDPPTACRRDCVRGVQRLGWFTRVGRRPGWHPGRSGTGTAHPRCEETSQTPALTCDRPCRPASTLPSRWPAGEGPARNLPPDHAEPPQRRSPLHQAVAGGWRRLRLSLGRWRGRLCREVTSPRYLRVR